MRDENARLKKLVADLSLDKDAMQWVIEKNGVEFAELKATVEQVQEKYAFSDLFWLTRSPLRPSRTCSRRYPKHGFSRASSTSFVRSDSSLPRSSARGCPKIQYFIVANGCSTVKPRKCTTSAVVRGCMR